MSEQQDRYDEAMFEFTKGNYDGAIQTLRALVLEEPDNFDAQLALGMALYRKGEFAEAIAEGHRAEKLKPAEQLVHTNLSLFYMKAGNKERAEHHGLQARIASWKGNMAAPGENPPAPGDSELQLGAPAPAPVKFSGKVPDMPWKKKSSSSSSGSMKGE